jgi:hypothetical protein
MVCWLLLEKKRADIVTEDKFDLQLEVLRTLEWPDDHVLLMLLLLVIGSMVHL